MESLLVNILVVGKVCVSSYTKLDSDVFCERRLIFFLHRNELLFF